MLQQQEQQEQRQGGMPVGERIAVGSGVDGVQPSPLPFDLPNTGRTLPPRVPPPAPVSQGEAVAALPLPPLPPLPPPPPPPRPPSFRRGDSIATEPSPEVLRTCASGGAGH